MKIKKSAFFSAISVFFSLAFFSCSNTIPRITTQKMVVVFDFSKERAAQRLSVFVEPTAELSRIREILIECRQSGLTWQIGEPDFVALKNTQWAGSANLVMQRPHNFLQGEYRLTLTDYNGKSAVSAFKIEYPEQLAKADYAAVQKAGTFPDLTRKFTILYGDASEVLFFGPAALENTEPAQIHNRYPKAILTQTYIESEKGSYAVLFPVNKIQF